jgi:DNA-binding response OmpR family regulator
MPSTEALNSRLLLCSSDREKLEPLKQHLEAVGVEVDCVTEAEEARQLMWDRHYDGVAVDLLLADRDGISFAMELRQEHPWVSILVVSTTQQSEPVGTAPDWLARSVDYARLVFALKQAGQRSAGRTPCILHVEDDDKLAELVQNTIGSQARLFRARSAQEAQIAMALRKYDLALIRTQMRGNSAQWDDQVAARQQAPLCIDTDGHADPFLTILNNLRRAPYVHEPAYC